ncbi:MAG: site-specific DNA-methyltransferase [Clostridiales bacterium]|nr:site-specific DNA-methyltransferase [Clostridiales bacterium]
MAPKDWMQSQIGVWNFKYEERDVRKKSIHPSTFPISMAKKTIELFSHKGELILDPFVGSGTTLVAANDLERNAIGFDLKPEYITLCNSRMASFDRSTQQIAIREDARNIAGYIAPNSVKMVFTSPPYANLLNRPRLNKSRRDRNNEQFGKVEQYSQDTRDLGILECGAFEKAIFEIFHNIRPLIKYKGHCVINISDIWMENKRVPLHINIVRAMEKAGYELRNTIIWDRRNIVNGIGIFGYPSNYITMGTTFEYLLDFWNPTNWGRAAL